MGFYGIIQYPIQSPKIRFCEEKSSEGFNLNFHFVTNTPHIKKKQNKKKAFYLHNVNKMLSLPTKVLLNVFKGQSQLIYSLP